MSVGSPASASQLARFDGAARARAKKAGKPLRRSHFPTVFAEPAKLIFSSGGRLVVSDPVRGGAGQQRPEPLTADKFAALMRRPDSLEEDRGKPLDCLVISDASVMTRVTRMVAAQLAQTDGSKPGTPSDPGREQFERLERQLAFRAGLPGSVALPVLTESLSLSFWLPAGYDPANIHDWVAAFSPTSTRVDPSAMPRALTFLADACHSGMARLPRDLASKLPWEEKRGLSLSRWTGQKMTCLAFKSATTLTTIHATIRASDPLLVDRNKIAGAVAELTIRGIAATSCTADVSGQLKVKEGTRVQVASADGATAEGTLRKIMVAQDTIRVVLTFSPRQFGLVRECHQRQEPVYLSELPYLPFGGPALSGRWMGGTADQINREVPVDVVLAGAPSTG